MKRKLLKQMLNEWKANVWLVVELLIVLFVLEFIFGALYSFYDMHGYASGNKLTDIYVADINRLHEEQDGFQPYDSVHSVQTDLDMLLTGLRSNPYAETVAATGYNSLPYNYNFTGNGYFFRKPDGSKSKIFKANRREMSPEMIEVLRIEGADGESPKRMADLLRKGCMLLSEPELEKDKDTPDARDFIGRETMTFGDTLTVLRVGGVAKPLRRNDYEANWYGTAYIPVKPGEAHYLAIRVKPGTGQRFLESLAESDMQAGNLYLTQFTSIDDMRDSAQLDIDQTIRNFVICALFLLLVIFLGFLGTFWFRTQQRVSEIAIRKVNGATNGNIYARFFGEGLILLATAVLISAPLTVWMVKSEITDSLNMMAGNTDALIAGAVLAVVSLTLLIVCGIFAPARRATRIDPAEALMDM